MVYLDLQCLIICAIISMKDIHYFNVCLQFSYLIVNVLRIWVLANHLSGMEPGNETEWVLLPSVVCSTLQLHMAKMFHLALIISHQGIFHTLKIEVNDHSFPFSITMAGSWCLAWYTGFNYPMVDQNIISFFNSNVWSIKYIQYMCKIRILLTNNLVSLGV